MCSKSNPIAKFTTLFQTNFDQFHFEFVYAVHKLLILPFICNLSYDFGLARRGRVPESKSQEFYRKNSCLVLSGLSLTTVSSLMPYADTHKQHRILSHCYAYVDFHIFSIYFFAYICVYHICMKLNAIFPDSKKTSNTLCHGNIYLYFIE